MESICENLISRRLCSGMCGCHHHAACIIKHNDKEPAKVAGVW
jgi:hypothetical protein